MTERFEDGWLVRVSSYLLGKSGLGHFYGSFALTELRLLKQLFGLKLPKRTPFTLKCIRQIFFIR